MSRPASFKKLLLLFAAATAAGFLLHFLYDWLPNPLTALFSPVRESLWEHLKIIYWPYLAAALIATRKTGRDQLGRWLFSLLVISVVMLAAGYVYHISLGLDNTVFDIALYVLLMAVGFWLPTQLNPSGGRSFPLIVLTILLGLAIILFTFLPPDHILFSDLSAVHTWYRIPC